MPRSSALRPMKPSADCEPQQASVAATDAIAREFADRLAGHLDRAFAGLPDRRAADRQRASRGPRCAAASRSSSAPAPRRPTPRPSTAHAQAPDRPPQPTCPNARGAGYDQRTGEVVLLVTRADADSASALDAIRARAEQVSGVPVRVVDQRAQRIQPERGRRRPGRRAQPA